MKQEIDSILSGLGLSSILAQNKKMRQSSRNNTVLYNFGIPAFKAQNGTFTCPNALNCAAGCYARSGAYIWANVKQVYEARLKLTQTPHFKKVITHQIDKLLERHKNCLILIRVHDSGDFYTTQYQTDWYDIAKTYQNEPKLLFYSYTKMVSQSEALAQIKPSNFRIIYSFGGREDSQIDTNKHYHSKVFENETSLVKSGYVNATNDDVIAAIGEKKKIGLVYHGTKKFANTNWSKVA